MLDNCNKNTVLNKLNKHKKHGLLLNLKRTVLQTVQELWESFELRPPRMSHENYIFTKWMLPFFQQLFVPHFTEKCCR